MSYCPVIGTTSKFQLMSESQMSIIYRDQPNSQGKTWYLPAGCQEGSAAGIVFTHGMRGWFFIFFAPSG